MTFLATAPWRSDISSNEFPVLTPDEFKLAFRHHPAGVAVITADDGSGPVAMTASSVISVSAVPPLLVFSASALSSSTPTIERASSVVVHMIGVEDLWLAKLGATSGVDRFEGVSWDRLPTGEPYYTDAKTWIRGRVASRLDVGSAVVFLVEATQASASAEGSDSSRVPLVYHNRAWHKLDNASMVTP